MIAKSMYAPAAALALLGVFAVTGCSKSALSVTQPPLGATSNAFPAVGSGEVWTTTLISPTTGNSLTVTEWINTVQGERNTATATVDVTSGYVMVGGGAQTSDPGGNPANVDAILTAAYPVPDNSFDMYTASNKDHDGFYYTSNLSAYAIGIKLTYANGTVVPRSDIIKHLGLNYVTSASAEHPSATAPTYPSNYITLSGGAFDNYGTGWGNLVYENDYSSSIAVAQGKDQNGVDACAITAYDLSYDNQTIDTWGKLNIAYYTNYESVTQSKMTYNLQALDNEAIIGVGGYSTQWTKNGRLLYSMYADSPGDATIQSKDQDQSDLTGVIGGIITKVSVQ